MPKSLPTKKTLLHGLIYSTAVTLTLAGVFALIGQDPSYGTVWGVTICAFLAGRDVALPTPRKPIVVYALTPDTANPNLILHEERKRFLWLPAALRYASELAFHGDDVQVYYPNGIRRGQAVHIAGMNNRKGRLA